MMEKQWGLKNEQIIVDIKGQKCIINTAEQTLTITIDTPFFSAGKQLNWSFENTVGVGVNTGIFAYCMNNGLQLKIEIEGYSYFVHNPGKLYRLCKSNRWLWRCGNTVLMILPLQILR